VASFDNLQKWFRGRKRARTKLPPTFVHLCMQYSTDAFTVSILGDSAAKRTMILGKVPSPPTSGAYICGFCHNEIVITKSKWTDHGECRHWDWNKTSPSYDFNLSTTSTERKKKKKSTVVGCNFSLSLSLSLSFPSL